MPELHIHPKGKEQYHRYLFTEEKIRLNPPVRPPGMFPWKLKSILRQAPLVFKHALYIYTSISR